jgi:hypothetical protein
MAERKRQNNAMRFWEIARPGQKIKIQATTRFMKALPAFVREYDTLAGKFHDFIEFRKTHPATEPYGPKDNNFNNADLITKIKHVHLIHGKVIVFYKVTNDTMSLYAIVNHNEYDQKNATARLVNWLNSMTQADFVRFDDQPKSSAPVISAGQIQDIKDLLWEMAADPDAKDDLVKATKGDFSGMMDFLTSLLPVEGSVLIAALGGATALQTMVTHILSNIAPVG